MKYDRDFYVERDKKLADEVAIFEKKSFKFSMIRLLLFIAFLSYGIAFFVVSFKILYGVLAVIFLSIFTIMCKKHDRLKEKINFLVGQYMANKQMIGRIDRDFTYLIDDGMEFYIDGHEYMNDLDIFGEYSVYALYNISTNYYGRKEFSNLLTNISVLNETPEEFIIRQNAIHEIAQYPVFIQEYQALGCLNKQFNIGNISNLEKTLKDSKKVMEKEIPVFEDDIEESFLVRNPYFLLLFWIIPLTAFFIWRDVLAVAIFLVLIINTIVWFINIGKYSKVLSRFKGIYSKVNVLAKLYSKLENSELNSEFFTEIKNRKFSETMRLFLKVSQFASLRDQPFFDSLINAVLPYNNFVLKFYYRWKKQHIDSFKEALFELGKVEAVMSLSMVELTSEITSIPEVSEKGVYLDGINLYHPLIDTKKVVKNSIKTNNNIVIITGSNMSGKTTFIRTVGINCLLAYMGASVLGESFSLSKMRIMSSMKIEDNIEEGISTFKAELDKISRIVKAVNDNKPMLFLIDEIFRGTNSLDRTEGAMTVLERLSYPNVTGFMTTHDYELCDKTQKQKNNIIYYHFAEKYIDDNIVFDYKINEGTSYASNAKYLMRMVGIY